MWRPPLESPYVRPSDSVTAEVVSLNNTAAICEMTSCAKKLA
jgi:hypothetical protein